MRLEVLQQELPEVEEKKKQETATISVSTGAGINATIPTTGITNGATKKTARRTFKSNDWEYALPLTKDACRCPHLEAYLPHILNLQCIPHSDEKTGEVQWRMTNPIHALHLSSQFDADGTANNLGRSFGKDNHQQFVLGPSLYGEEQHRTTAIMQGGISSCYCPLVTREADPQLALSNQIKYGASSEYGRIKREESSMKGPLALPSKQIIPLPPPVSSSSTFLQPENKSDTLSEKDDKNVKNDTNNRTINVSTNSTIVKFEPKDQPGSSKTEADKQKSVTFVKNEKQDADATAKFDSESKQSLPTSSASASASAVAPVEVKSSTEEGSPSSAKSATAAAPSLGESSGPHQIKIELLQSSTTEATDQKNSTNKPEKVMSSNESKTDEAIQKDTPLKLEPPQTTSSSTIPPPIPPSLFLPEGRYRHLRYLEDCFLKQQKTVFSKRKFDAEEGNSSGNKKKSSSNAAKKRKSGSSKTGSTRTSPSKSGIARPVNGDKGDGISRSASKTIFPFDLGRLKMFDFGENNVELPQLDKKQWEHTAQRARARVEEWMDVLQVNRRNYWELTMNGATKLNKADSSYDSFCVETAQNSSVPHCGMCKYGYGSGESKRHRDMACALATGDELVQCLDCSFIGCAPCSLYSNSRQHIVRHFLRTGHNFGITCGKRADLYCFKCGDTVYHDLFDEEKERIEVSYRLPWLGWKDHPVQRSFDPLQFLTVPDHGVLWRGLVATYPKLVSKEHLLAARLSMKRSLIFRGEVDGRSLQCGSKALELAAHQQAQGGDWKLCAPVGMYNLGNTCFMSAVIQCLLHCMPLQRHFLYEIGHHHDSCEVIRQSKKKLSSKNKEIDTKKDSSICLACEMDVLFLKYFGSTIGKDVLSAVRDLRSSTEPHIPRKNLILETTAPEYKGEPLVVSDLLTAAWKCGSMDHLAGYEQRDGHEFLQAFLDIMGKHCLQYRKRVRLHVESLSTGDIDKRGSGASLDEDIIKYLFEGTLRSVLICDECSCKRMLSETFLNISLPLSSQNRQYSATKAKASVQRCLKHFTAPEALTDPVQCPSCKMKTLHKKQHTFARLPRVLCLHLKRFDAANNKKIDDFVEFPAYDLDLGPFLPHWCEVRQGQKTNEADDGLSDEAMKSSPQILYDLFGTVNHNGTLHQGHYVSHVKIEDQWYHCNDAYVSKCEEKSVLKSGGAYVLFYIRR